MTDTVSRLPIDRPTPLELPPELARIRAEAPVSPLAFPGGTVGWLVTGYAEVRAGLADTRLSSAATRIFNPVREVVLSQEDIDKVRTPSILTSDPPDHTRYRRALTGQFTVRRMRALEPRVDEIVEQHLDAMAADPDRPVDLVQALALPVPSLVICELLGVPYADRESFQHRTATLLRNDVTREQILESVQGLNDYMRDLVRAKRQHPSDDLLSDVIQAEPEGVPLTEDELVGIGNILLLAGHETTANMIGLGTLTLLSRPGRWQDLSGRPELLDATVEELLRYLTIIHFGLVRVAATDVELGGQLIRAGEPVLLHLPAANHDPGQFAAPDEFDPERENLRHLAFGFGVHQCLGQQLARTEMKMVFGKLARRFPDLRLAGEVPMRSDMGIYGVHELPVTWG